MQIINNKAQGVGFRGHVERIVGGRAVAASGNLPYFSELICFSETYFMDRAFSTVANFQKFDGKSTIKFHIEIGINVHTLNIVWYHCNFVTIK